jgi:hypothetical protein
MRSTRLAAFVARKLWAFPNTVVGIAFAIASLLCAWAVGRRPKLSLGHNAIQVTESPLVPTAIALGHVVVYGTSPRWQPDRLCGRSGQCLAHEEMQHTLQAEVLGPLYLPAHALLGIAAWLIDGRWHGPTNILETGPHAEEPRPWRSLSAAGASAPSGSTGSPGGSRADRE